MKNFFKDLFGYHHHFNKELLLEIKKYQAQLPDKTFPLFCHVLNAHQVWNSRILGSTAFGVHQRHDLENCFEINDTNYLDTLKIIEADDLERIVGYKNSRGDGFENKLSDILFHVINHSTHHKAQIVAQFSQSGLQPLVTDYIFYKRQK